MLPLAMVAGRAINQFRTRSEYSKEPLRSKLEHEAGSRQKGSGGSILKLILRVVALTP